MLAPRTWLNLVSEPAHLSQKAGCSWADVKPLGQYSFAKEPERLSATKLNQTPKKADVEEEHEIHHSREETSQSALFTRKPDESQKTHVKPRQLAVD